MVGEYAIKIPVEIEAKGGKLGDIGNKLGKDISDRIGKGMKGLGLGKVAAGAGVGAGVATTSMAAGVALGLKTLGISVAIGALVAGVAMIVAAVKDFPIVVAIFKLWKLLMMILLIPLIPILKPVLLGMAKGIKLIAPWLKQMADAIEAFLGPEFVESLSSVIADVIKWIGIFVIILTSSIVPYLKIFVQLMGVVFSWLETNFEKIISALGTFAPMLLTAFIEIVDFLLENWQTIFGALVQIKDFLLLNWQTIIDALIWVGNWLTERWEDIKGILKWAGEFLEPIWDTIKTILENAGNAILPQLIVVTVKLGNILIDLYNAISWIVRKITFGMWDLGTLEKLKMPEMQLGGPIPETGPYLLHKGEHVIPAGGGTVININIDRPSVRSEEDIRNLVREISRRLQTDMRGRISYI